MENTKSRTGGEMAKSFGYAVLMGIILGVLVRLVIPGLNGEFVFAIIVFGATLDLLLEHLEKERATNRLIKRILPFLGGAMVFMAMRIVLGYLFGMPILALAPLAGYALETKRNLSQDVVLEVLFAILAIAIVYNLIKGDDTMRKKMQKYFVSMAAIGFCLVLFQAKYPEANAELNRIGVNGRINLATQVARVADWTTSQPALVKTTKESPVFVLKNNTLNDSGQTVKAGATVLSLGGADTTIGGLVYRRIVLPDPKGQFENGARVWIDARAFTKSEDSTDSSSSKDKDKKEEGDKEEEKPTST
ncbi:MAG: hypothetical protein WC244_03540 [Patescibacteria group bacterium]|jgi:hypothetical protein